ncbi:MAG: type II toxin-antitoxin system RelB/DinJ family antitoxin [Oscillospiraceae bacterium]|nr:type II toxin-antitoxin system RelB/DinJ family antitoxin [Oscillospiraceae bacterium]
MDVKEINNGDGTISLCFEIDEELYKQLTEILAPQGLTLEKAIELFLRETVRLGRIPFDITDEDIAAAKAMHEKKQ